MKTKEATVTTNMPPGEYIVGDPLYTLKKDMQQEYHSMSVKAKTEPFSVQGMKCLNYYTVWGDGEYADKDGFNYPVDSGSIGLVPANLTKLDDHNKQFIKMVSFDQPFTCYADYNRMTLTFGHITINLS